MAIAKPALAKAPAADVRNLPPPDDGFYPSLMAFLAADIPEPDELLAGLHRGEVALMVSDEAQGKTHLLLQLSLALAGGQPVLPISSKDKTPRRILYVNGGDAAPSRIRDELEAMLPYLADEATAMHNFASLLEASLHRQPLNLYRHSHWQWFAALVKQQATDLIIIDGMREPLTLTGRSSAAARLELLRNARQLADDCDCAVLVACTTSSRRRLLGTAQAQCADTIYSLISDRRRDEQYRQWRCLQSRWQLPNDLELHRDKNGRGYRSCQAEPQGSRPLPSYTNGFDAGRGRESAQTAAFMPAGATSVPSYNLRSWMQKVGQERGEGLPLRRAVPSPQAAASLAETAKPVGVAEAVSDETKAAPLGGVTTEAANDAPKKKGGKQASKRHNKKMRRYR